MSIAEIIRAWRDEEYRYSLSDVQRALLPESPVGIVELSDEDLDIVAGGSHLSCACTNTCQCTHHVFSCPTFGDPCCQ